MVTVRQLHETLIREEIKQNYFLSAINEALNTGNLQIAVTALDKIDDLAAKALPDATSLQTAIEKARKDAMKLLKTKDKEEASEITAKLVTFYSKMWSFLSKDLPALSKLLVRDFLKPTTPGDTLLYTIPNINEFRETLTDALTNEESPWYRKIIAFLSGSKDFISAIPYINIETFVNEILTMKKDDFLAAIGIAQSKSSATMTPQAFATAFRAVTGTPPAVVANPVVNLTSALNDAIRTIGIGIPGHDTDKLKAYILDRVFIQNMTFPKIEQELAADPSLVMP